MSATAQAGGIVMDTFPKYLLRNAERFGAQPAMRHKDYGIWQTWTWAQGERVGIVGANRPRLYWAMTAVQSLGAIPVPVYADAVAEELAYVLNNSGVRFAIVQDQEQVDKIQSFASEIPHLEYIIFDEPRGLQDYAREGLYDFAAVEQRGVDLCKADPGLAKAWEDNVRAGSGDDISVMLYTSGTTGRSKGVMSAERCIAAARDTVVFDKLTDRDEELAYLPLAWVGDHYHELRPGLCRRLLRRLPGKRGHGGARSARDRPDLLFRAAARVRIAADRVMIRMEDAGALKRRMFHHYIGVARKNGARRSSTARAVPLGARLCL
jgi:long-chain acyl-CoA synthetase